MTSGKQGLDEPTKNSKNTDDRGLVVDYEGRHVALDNRGCSLYSPDVLRKTDGHQLAVGAVVKVCGVVRALLQLPLKELRHRHGTIHRSR